MIVCSITNKIHSGGAGKSIQILLSNMPKDVKPVILTRSSTNKTTLRYENIKYIRIKSGFFPFSYLSGARDPVFLNYLAWGARLFFLPVTLGKIRSLKADIIILNGFQAIWYAPFISRKTCIVFYARELLNMEKKFSVFAMKIINKFVDHIICISENEKKQFKTVNCPASVVYNSAQDHIISTQESSTQKRDNTFKIGIFGTITHVKGQYLVVELVEKYLERIQSLNIRFYVFGGDSSITTRHDGREELIKKVLEKKIMEYIELPGWVDDVSSHMRKMDLILRTDTTGCPWGRDIIEAMSNGLPIIASGDSEIFIKPGINGYLFGVKDITDMAKCIFEIAENHQLRKKMGAAALLFAEENFSSSNNANKVYKILTEAVKKHNEVRSILR